MGGTQNIYGQITAMALAIDYSADPFNAWVKVNPERADADYRDHQYRRYTYQQVPNNPHHSHGGNIRRPC
jgi:hypothetical protein